MDDSKPDLSDSKDSSEKELNPSENEASIESDAGGGGDSGGGSNDSSGEPPDDRNDGYTRVSLIKEVEESFLGYAMSVIIGRALPDVRDGLKPVHRRCLFAMHELNNYHNRPTIKSARVAGDVSGKYHPHGDQSTYETLVRMAQEFSMRYPLIEGQGNFGSVDGDPPAAPRYTEMRLQRITSMMLQDINEETVDFEPNYDDTLSMPSVLPARVPNLLINGSDGIAVAIATKIPPHNLGEVIDACIATIQDPEITIEGLMEHIKGPDFPTGAIINGRAGIVEAYTTGRGSIVIRSRAEVIQNGNQDMIVVTEIPYHVNKANLIKKIAELVKVKRIEGISDLRDESDKDGLRIAIELKRGEIGQTILNALYRYTELETSYSVNWNALVGNTPRRLTLKEQIEYFLAHRREIIARRTIFRLRRSRARGHTIEGQAIALANIDEVLTLIRQAESRAVAEEALLERTWDGSSIKSLLSEAERDIVRPLDLEEEYGFQSGEEGSNNVYKLSPAQAKAIVELRLHRLTSLESDELSSNYKAIVDELRDLMEIQDSEDRAKQVMIEELTEVRDMFADERRTEIQDAITDLTAKALIKPQDVVITVSHNGYAKAIAAEEYSVQGRGGKGVIGVKTRENDFSQHVLVTHSHNTLLVFTNLGRVFWLDAYKIPMAGRNARGYPLINLLKFEEGERATCFFPISDKASTEGYLFFATRKGVVKRTLMSQFTRPRSVGLKAIRLDEDDQLVDVAHTDGRQDIMLVQSGARLVRFKESDIRAVARTARGVVGIRLRGDDEVISLIVPEESGMLCAIDELGKGKRVDLNLFNVKGRGNLGQLVKRRGVRLAGALQVLPGDHLMLLSESGKFIRIEADKITQMSAYANGVKLMSASSEDHILDVVRVPPVEVEDPAEEADEAAE